MRLALLLTFGIVLFPGSAHAQEASILSRLFRAAARSSEKESAVLARRLASESDDVARAVLRRDAAALSVRAGTEGACQALRHPEFLEAAREARRLGRLDEFLAGARNHGDAFVVWVGKRWKEVGLITAMATFVAVAPTAVEEAGLTARAGVHEMGGFGVFGCVGLFLAAGLAWNLLRRRRK